MRRRLQERREQERNRVIDPATQLSRDALLALVQRILAGDRRSEEARALVRTFQENVPYPQVEVLLFYAFEKMPPEQIVDEALRDTASAPAIDR